MAAIALQQVHKAYPDGAAVIRDLSIDIHDGEFMVLVGPSGCGKSTTLRMIAGLEALSSGSLRIGTRVVNDLAPKDRDVAMVFQSYALYPHMTVRDNIAFGLQVRKLPADEVRRRVDAAADTLGLGPELDRKPRALSGGQRQRVALGRALVRQPAVFLFDEPLSNLDAELRVHMRAELCRLQRRLATTAVYVTHDQTEALTMGHRIAVLRPCGKAPGLGNLTQVGTPHEVYHRPANLFTARFIGTPRMNLLPALLGADGTRVLCLDQWLPVPPALWDATRPRAGQPVTLGLRAEHLRPAAELDGAAGMAIRAQVEIVEPLGHEALVYVECRGQHLAGRLRSVLGLPRPGEAIELMVQADAMHLFDPASEARLG